MLMCAFIVCLFTYLYGIPWTNTIISQSLLQLMDIWIVSRFRLLQTMLLSIPVHVLWCICCAFCWLHTLEWNYYTTDNYVQL